jgi:hypothetical protein
MLVKLYWLMWVLGILAVALFYFTGNFTPVVAIVFGFLSFGAIFMGIIGVLPISVTHPPAKH